MDPDILQNAKGHMNGDGLDYGPRFKQLKITDNVRELQTVLRDKLVYTILNSLYLVVDLLLDTMYF